jgi:hypothetical protein
MTATRRDLRESLEAIGRRPVPAPRADFVASLEARLGGATPSAERGTARATPDVATVVPLRKPSSMGRITVLMGSAAAAVAAIVLAGSLAGWFGGGSDAANIELTDAVETTVQLPDGSVVRGEEGLLLPDGAVVRTGPEGTAAAGGVEIGPGEEATVEDGELLPGVSITLPTVPSLPPIDITVPTLPGLPGT